MFYFCFGGREKFVKNGQQTRGEKTNYSSVDVFVNKERNQLTFTSVSCNKNVTGYPR